VSCGEYREDDELWTMGYDYTMDLLLSDWDGRKMAFYLDTGSMFMDWERQNSLFSEKIVLNAKNAAGVLYPFFSSGLAKW
jgi:hypothetical protein